MDKMGRIIGILAICSALDSLWADCVETPQGVKLEKDGKVIWNFQIDNPEKKPFIHPLNLPDGTCVTDVRPKDHIWHLGLWFCWKFINRVNYWEPVPLTGLEPAGMTIVTGREIRINGDSADVHLSLAYRPRKRADLQPLLVEARDLRFSAPNAKGGYAITATHHFVAKRDVLLDRTPPRIQNETASGGYAGFTFRGSPILAGFVKSSSCGETSQLGAINNERKWLQLTSPTTGHGIKFEILQATPQSRFYHWKNNCFVNPCPVYTAPIVLKAGEKLDLSYRITVF